MSEQTTAYEAQPDPRTHGLTHDEANQLWHRAQQLRLIIDGLYYKAEGERVDQIEDLLPALGLAQELSDMVQKAFGPSAWRGQPRRR